MKHILLFDQDLQPYREGVYRFFAAEFKKMGYELVVLYDAKLNKRPIQDANMLAWSYSFLGFVKALKQYKPSIIIQFVWLRYFFLFPFMIYARIMGKKIILWSHGVNLQKRDHKLMNQLYYLRQRLANTLVIYHEDQMQYVVKDSSDVFIANNTLNFNEFPEIEATKEQLKQKHGFAGIQVLFCVGRMNMNNRKLSHLIELAELLDENQKVVLVGPGVETQDIVGSKLVYLGVEYDQVIVNEYYKMADIFVMPGAIGLAINQAFYHSVPAIIEDVYQGPEGGYLKEGLNGYVYKTGDVADLETKVDLVLGDKDQYEVLSRNAYETMKNEGSIEKMFDGFRNAVKYVSN
jgi:glycosyltransferase involved in cell wall biosynthesis